jgi:hypothetical protein
MICYLFNKIYHFNSVKKNNGQNILKYPCPSNTLLRRGYAQPEAPQGRLVLIYVARSGFPVIVNTVPIFFVLSLATVAGAVFVIHVLMVKRKLAGTC